MNTIPNDGIIRYFWFFNSERVLVTSPQSMAEVLVTKSYSFQKPAHVRKIYRRILGRGLILAEGEEHKAQRRGLQSAFHFRHIKQLYPVFWEKGRELVKAVAAECVDNDAAEIEVDGWVSRCTLDIIGLAGFGQDFGAIKDKNSAFVQACFSLFEPSGRTQALRVLASLIPVWVTNRLPVKINSDINQAATLIREECLEMIRSKAAARLAKGGDQDVDILTVATEGGQFTSEDLVDQIMTFLAAGHGTSAGIMTWAAYMLAKNPDMQARLRNEVRGTISSLDAAVSSTEIDGMPYLNAFCNETLRYWSPIPITARAAVEDTTILGHPVRRGTHVSVCLMAMNRDRAQWGPGASEFKPERWMAKRDDQGKPTGGGGGASSNYSFATFSHGARSCIGITFAKAEFACLLAAWVGKFEFELADKELVDEQRIKIARGLVAKPLGGVRLIVRVLPGF